MLHFTPEEMAKATFAKGKGCADCRGTGHKGRIGVFELILGTPELRAAIAKQADYPTMLKIAEEQGYISMITDGKQKAMLGWTTPGEVIKAVYTQTLD